LPTAPRRSSSRAAAQYNAAVGLSPRLARCLTLVALALGACDRAPPGPDLGRLYRVGTQFADITPVIVVPGLFGSKLRDRTTGVEVWPGTARMLLFDNYRQLALDFDRTTLAVRSDNLEAFDIADAALGEDFYGKIITTLHDFGGYVHGVVGVPPQAGERRYYIFPYDWRQDNVEAARGLDRLIESIRRDYGDPALRVDIVAHSMGGLVARYYQRYGTDDVLDGRESQVTLYGTSRVRKLILLGTPNMGSASSLHAFLIGEAIGFGRIPQEALATLPSGYELFPHPLVTWLIDVSGQVRHDDLFDGKTWRRYRWSIFDPAVEARIRAAHGADADAYLAALGRFFDYRLERARRFLWALSTPEPPTQIRYVLFGGDCDLTPARLALEDVGGTPTARLYPDQIVSRVPGVPYAALMLEPGDGSVTKPSLLARETLDPSAPQNADSFIPVAYWFFLCEQHEKLTGNINFQDNLLNVLLTRRLPWEMEPHAAQEASVPGRQPNPSAK
jgi:pimeloyl-ACP methyl ester carboxylesterase